MSRNKPITDPRAGHYGITIGFTVAPWDGASIKHIEGRLRHKLQYALGYRTPPLEGLSVAVRVIGAQGSAAEDEGRVEL